MEIVKQYLARAAEIIGERTPDEERYDREVMRWLEKGKPIKKAIANIIVEMESGIEVKFPAAENPRLAIGTPRQLNRIEIAPLGLHWPDLDEDLSFRGILQGNFGQKRRMPSK